MQAHVERYSRFGLVRDMLATPEVVRHFKHRQMAETAQQIAAIGKLLLTGEGSSRIFPAKNAIAHSRRMGWPLTMHTEAGRQAREYALKDWAVFAMSNSGRTAEVIRLFTDLKTAGHQSLFSLTAFAGSLLESHSTKGYTLSCGPEGAVAATKSVMEQALFYRALVEAIAGESTLEGRLGWLGDKIETALMTSIPLNLIERIATAGTIYWAGRNDGVAEELTLKSNEITRKPADYLEGTYAVHGIEEVMNPGDVLLWIDPYSESEQKFGDVLAKGVGMTIIAISSRPTQFPTILIPDAGDLSPFVQMAAGWNVLVDVGIQLGIDLDKPQRARKVGNEFVG